MARFPTASLDPRGTDPESSIVRAIAVVGVIFGTLGMSCLPFNLGEFVSFGWPVEGARADWLDLWCLFATFIELGLSTLLLFCSLGAYHFKWWARYGLLLWATCSLGYGVVGIYFWGRFLLPPLRSEYAAMRGPDEFAGLLAWLVGTGLSIFVLRFLTRPAIRMVFTESGTHTSETSH